MPTDTYAVKYLIAFGPPSSIDDASMLLQTNIYERSFPKIPEVTVIIYSMAGANGGDGGGGDGGGDGGGNSGGDGGALGDGGNSGGDGGVLGGGLFG